MRIGLVITVAVETALAVPRIPLRLPAPDASRRARPPGLAAAAAVTR